MLHPDQWAREIKDAMEKADGHIDPAAEQLDISRAQLFRYLQDPLLKDAKRAPPGRPPENPTGRGKRRRAR